MNLLLKLLDHFILSFKTCESFGEDIHKTKVLFINLFPKIISTNNFIDYHYQTRVKGLGLTQVYLYVTELLVLARSL